MTVLHTAAADGTGLPEQREPGEPKPVAWWEAYPNSRLVALVFLTGVLIQLMIDLPDWLGRPRVGTPLVIATILLYRAIYQPAGLRLRGMLLVVAALLLGAFAAALGLAAFQKFRDVSTAVFAAVFLSAIPAVMLVKIWREYRRSREAAREPKESD